MSYILDALKRLEQDKQRSRKGANPMEAVLLPDTEGGPGPKRRRLWWAGTGVALLVAVIAVTSWVTRRTVLPPVEPAAEGTAAPFAPAPPGGQGSSFPSVPEVPASTPSPPLQPEPSGARVSALTEEASSKPAERIPSVPPPEEPAKAEDLSPPMETEEEIGSEFFEEEEVTADRRETMPLPVGAPEDGAIPEWEGSEIKINAIAYSQDPRSRFAVVNLKTVHEGEQVEGLSVLAIQENGIVFEGEGGKFRVSLGRR
jgi:hypothetical protein